MPIGQYGAESLGLKEVLIERSHLLDHIWMVFTLQLPTS